MYFSKISATGSCAPDKIVTNDDLSKIVDTNDEWIVSRSGIKRRHFSSGENASDLATGAAEEIIKRSGIDPLDIELIIVATVSADYTTPSTACLVQANIGAANAVAFDVGAACAGFMFGLSVADKYIKCGVYKNAIIIGTEVLSKYLDFNDRGTCVLFGDGAAGVLLERTEEQEGILCEEIGSDGFKAMALTKGFSPAGNVFNNVSREADRSMKMDGKAIFDFATRSVPVSVKKLLEKSGRFTDEIDFVIPHQANSRIVEIISRKLKMPLDKFYMNMDEYGNTSSASIPLALNEMVEKGIIKKGSLCIFTGFGAGLTWGSMLVKF